MGFRFSATCSTSPSYPAYNLAEWESIVISSRSNELPYRVEGQKDWPHIRRRAALYDVGCFVYRPFTVVSMAQTRRLWRAGYAERCPSGSEGGSWKRARKSNALAAYPIVEVTDSSSVSPTLQKSGFIAKPLFCRSMTHYAFATRSPMPSSRVRCTPAVS